MSPVTLSPTISAVKLPKWATALDVIALAMALLAISTFVFGGFRLPIPGGRLSVTDGIRPALWAAVALAIRHALIRRQPLPQRIVAATLEWWRQPDTRVVLPIHLATRGGALAVGFLAVILVGFPPEAASRWRIYSNDFFDLPARWDTGWYLGIAMEGYEWNPSYRPEQQQNVAFFPALPMLMRYLSPVFGRQPLWTGVGVSLVAFFIGLIYFLRLARQETGDERASVAAVVFLAAYPFAVFFSAAYTEALFFLTIVAAIYHFRNDRFVPAALWGVAAGLTRPNGFLLSVVLGLMALTAKPGRLMPRLAVAASPVVGMLAFSAYIYTLTGNPFQWATQTVAWGRVYRSLDTVVSDRIGFISTYGLYGYASTQTLDLFYLLAVLFALGAVWPVYRRFGLGYAAMLLVNVLPPIAAGGLLSMGRVTSVLFPAFMWMGAAVPERHRLAWVAAFAVLQGFVAVMFFTWRPLY